MTDVQLTPAQRDMLNWFIESKHSYNVTSQAYHRYHTKPRSTADSLVALGLLEVIEDDGASRTYRLVEQPQPEPTQWGYFVRGLGEAKPCATLTNEADARRFLAEQVAILRDGFKCDVRQATNRPEWYVVDGDYLTVTLFVGIQPLDQPIEALP